MVSTRTHSPPLPVCVLHQHQEAWIHFADRARDLRVSALLLLRSREFNFWRRAKSDTVLCPLPPAGVSEVAIETKYVHSDGGVTGLARPPVASPNLGMKGKRLRRNTIVPLVPRFPSTH